MKKFFVICIIFMASVAFVEAQQKVDKKTDFQTPETGLENDIRRFTDSLLLTTDQAKKIRVIETDLQKQMSERIMKVLGDAYAQIDILVDIDNIREEKFKLVLTPEQFKKYQKLFPKMKPLPRRNKK